MQWKDVVGFENYFKVSEFGDVWSKRTDKLLKQHLHPNGYFTLATQIGGRKGVNYCFKIHRLVAEAFLNSPSQELVDTCSKQAYGLVIVRHLDNNKTNNHYSNLAWGTHQDNTDDFIMSEGYAEFRALWSQRQSGVNSSKAVLNDDQVQYIRDNYIPFCKLHGARAIAILFGVHHTTISRVARGVRYK